MRPAIGLPTGCRARRRGVQQRCEARLQHHEQASHPRGGRAPQRGCELCGRRRRTRARRVGRDRRAGPVGRQLELLGQLRERAPPVGQLAGDVLSASVSSPSSRAATGRSRRTGPAAPSAAPPAPACRVGGRQVADERTPSDQPSPAMWCTTSSSTCSSGRRGATDAARSGSSAARSKRRRGRSRQARPPARVLGDDASGPTARRQPAPSDRSCWRGTAARSAKTVRSTSWRAHHARRAPPPARPGRACRSSRSASGML